MIFFRLGSTFQGHTLRHEVLTRENYRKLAAYRSYFGEFDPFGDFDLIFGAARMALHHRRVPVHYRERTYGETNIHRWRHGMLLLRMLESLQPESNFSNVPCMSHRLQNEIEHGRHLVQQGAGQILELGEPSRTTLLEASRPIADKSSSSRDECPGARMRHGIRHASWR
jgi:hypothetical protein